MPDSEAVRTIAELVSAAALTAATAGVLRDSQRRRTKSYVRAEIRFPADVKIDAVTHLLGDLASALPPVRGPFDRDVVGLEVVATHTGIRHFLEAPRARYEHILPLVFAAIPGASLSVVDAGDQQPSPTLAIELGLSDPCELIRTDNAAAVNRSLLAALQPLRANEELRLVWLLANGRQGSAGPAIIASALRRASLANDRGATDALKAKQDVPLCWAVGRVGAIAADVGRARQLVARVTAVLGSVATLHAHIERRRVSERVAARRMVERATPVLEFPALFNVRELSAIVAWPINGAAVPGIDLATGRAMPPSPNLPIDGRALGRANYPGRERTVAQPLSDTTRHTWIVGASGSGKSVLLARQALSEISAPMKRGVVLFDMKSDTVDSVLERFPRHRDDDLIVLDVRSDRPIGLNPLDGATSRPEFVADQLFAIFKRLWKLESAPRTCDLLYACLLTLAYNTGSTVVDLGPLLTNPRFRSEIVRRHQDDPVLGAFWASFEAMSVGERSQVVSPLLTRVRQVLLRPDLRVLLGQSRSALDLNRVLNQGKVLLVPLSSGVIGTESAALLSALLLSSLWTATQARAALPLANRRPVSVFIDEWQIASSGVTDMAEVLSLARGYGVGFTLANQSPQQLSPALRDAVATNCRTKICFGTSAGDATLLAKELGGGVRPDDVSGLGRYEALASVALGDATAPPVTVQTQGLPDGSRDPRALRRQSADRFGRPRDEVEADIRHRHAMESPVGTPGVRRREP